MGTPQGGVISPIIANMALDGLQDALDAQFRAVRYADDFVVIGASREALKAQALPVVRAFLAERGLTLARTKTKITNIEDGFDFLGFTFREYEDQARVIGHKKGIFLVTPSKVGVQAFKRRLKRIFQASRHTSPRALIVTLNPILRGWCQYYKSVNSSRTFSRMGAEVWKRLWAWCRKKHPRMLARALRKKYFTRVGGNRWVFYARTPTSPTITLVQMARTKIVRHRLCLDLNPFLPENKGYYLRRRKLEAAQRVQLNAQRSKLLKKQGGTCPVCGAELLDGEPLEVHHIKRRMHGGSDALRNLLLLHQACHRQVTYSKDTRLKAAWRGAGIVAEASSAAPGAPSEDISM